MYLESENSGIVRSVRLVALLLFALVTLYGLYLLSQGDWRHVGTYWLGRRRLLVLGFALSICDILTDACIWLLILRRLGVPIAPLRGMVLFFTGYAGLLMPVQMGRFYRATEVVRLGHGNLAATIKAEVILLAFAAAAAVAVFAGAFLYQYSVAAALPVSFIVLVFLLFLGDQVMIRLPWLTKRFTLELPPHFWIQPGVICLAVLAATGWLLNGAILYLVASNVTEALYLQHTIMIVTSNLFVGVATGLPGGLGISETYIGAMMYWLRTPPEHLVMAVAAFRVITFWIWIPIGWCAVLFVGTFLSRGENKR